MAARIGFDYQLRHLGWAFVTIRDDTGQEAQMIASYRTRALSVPWFASRPDDEGTAVVRAETALTTVVSTIAGAARPGQPRRAA